MAHLALTFALWFFTFISRSVQHVYTIFSLWSLTSLLFLVQKYGFSIILVLLCRIHSVRRIHSDFTFNWNLCYWIFYYLWLVTSVISILFLYWFTLFKFLLYTLWFIQLNWILMAHWLFVLCLLSNSFTGLQMLCDINSAVLRTIQHLSFYYFLVLLVHTNWLNCSFFLTCFCYYSIGFFRTVLFSN